MPRELPYCYKVVVSQGRVSMKQLLSETQFLRAKTSIVDAFAQAQIDIVAGAAKHFIQARVCLAAPGDRTANMCQRVLEAPSRDHAPAGQQARSAFGAMELGQGLPPLV